MLRHGGRVLTDQLELQGVRRVYSVPGESFLAALDGLHDSGIENVVCRHEGGAAMMADAHGKLTGTPGVAFVTRGPGASNAAAGIHIASQDSTPVILFVGQVERGHRDREAFQELDYRAVFGSMAKWVGEIDSAERLPEYVSRAFHVAQSGRPGPVVLALPEDMLSQSVTVPDLPARTPPVETVSDAAIDAILARLVRAARPLVIVGGSIWSRNAAHDVARFGEAWNLPIAVSFRRQDRMDNRHPNYVGDLGVGMNPSLAARMSEADCLLVIGSRLGDVPTGGYTLLDPARADKTLIHVHRDPDTPGEVHRPDLSIAAAPTEIVARLARRSPPSPRGWSGWTRAARADYEAWTIPMETPGDVKLEEVVVWLSTTLPDTAIATNGAGNYAAWVHRYFRARSYPGQLAPTSGSMGYGLPAAIAAKLEHPDRTVVCFAGDGCFQMTLNEFSTARQHGAAVIVILCNNGHYGTIRMHQEKTYPGRVSGTAMFNPDYAAFAAAYGGHGERVTRSDAFPAAFRRAEASRLPAIIELALDPEALSPALTMSAARGPRR